MMWLLTGLTTFAHWGVFTYCLPWLAAGWQKTRQIARRHLGPRFWRSLLGQTVIAALSTDEPSPLLLAGLALFALLSRPG